jgi:hypothetical protein
VSACSGERGRRGAADPRTGSGHDHDLVGEAAGRRVRHGHVSGLVRLLADGQERGWGELRAPVAKSTLSHHLKVLRDAGITWTRQEGTRCFVQLRRDDLDTRFPQLMAALLSVAAADGVGKDVTVAR